jgi:hypothetical protein
MLVSFYRSSSHAATVDPALRVREYDAPTGQIKVQIGLKLTERPGKLTADETPPFTTV